MTQDSTRSQTKLQEKPTRNMTEAKNLPELTRDVDMVINKGIGMLKQEHILRVDGSNFQTWEQRLRLIFDSYLQDPLYLQSGYVGDKKHEQFCRAVLLSSVLDSIQENIVTIRPCHAIYTWLKNHYFATPRSSQCVAFNKLLSIEIRNDKAPSSPVMQMNEALAQFKNRSGNLGDNYGPKTTDIQPSFNSITMTPATDSPEGEGHTALRTTMQLICHTCNKRGHMARSCPALLGQRTNTAEPINHAFKQVVAPPHYHAHYPIITPPVNLPFNSFHQKQHLNLISTGHAINSNRLPV
ncbi:hypothetical protein O181_026893 [Austropuccinia psidii MF-1]|uniref:CCHC-type domain-containing protein n=1 Tax=Austropuccinia psidii MF-1 TaxID=1389203 RepID=A0A9Q3H0F3_9BASI|nr:hypothetical protein [Austropuccinia psidii MF-1]